MAAGMLGLGLPIYAYAAQNLGKKPPVPYGLMSFGKKTP